MKYSEEEVRTAIF
jgi:hypothetical protein